MFGDPSFLSRGGPKKFQSIKLSDRIIIEDMTAENKRRQRQKVHEKFTLLHKNSAFFANGEK
jgi:hypothetical protein